MLSLKNMSQARPSIFVLGLAKHAFGLRECTNAETIILSTHLSIFHEKKDNNIK
jgi:hypothetical protein